MERIDIRVRRPLQDRAFRAFARAAAGVTLGVMALIFVSLVARSTKAVHAVGLGKFLTTQEWLAQNGKFGIGSVLFNTIVIALIAIVIAVPVSVGAALFITEYSPPAIRGALTAVIDLLAAVPSVIYGIWGTFFLEPRAIHVSRWLTDHLSFVPILKTTSPRYGGSPFIAGLVVALMVTPIVTAVVREVFSQAPRGECEGALALGGTQWGMIRTVVLPFGRGGIIGGTMLGFGRALGETVAVALIISSIFVRSTHILQQGANSIAALIAQQWGEANPVATSALMAAGMALFVFTLAVNAASSVIVSRSRSGTATEI